MSATALYVKACRCLYSNEMGASWDQLLILLPQLRTALSCRVCRGLVVDPQSSRYCQHYVCKGCLKKKRALNPGCKWCLDWNKLEQSDRQVRVVLACYKLLCEKIRSSDYYNNSGKDAKIDNLLKEVISHPDVLPESSYKPSKESRSWQANSPAGLTSRDTGKLCARENVTKIVTKVDNATKPAKEGQPKYFKCASFISDSKHISKVSLMPEKYLEQSRERLDSNRSDSKEKIGQCDNDQRNIGCKRKSNRLEPSVLDSEINNETEHALLPNTRNLDKIESSLRSQNRRMLQSCKRSTYQKKRKLQQMIGGFENSKGSLCRSVDQHWKNRPRKQCKLEFGIYTVP